MHRREVHLGDFFLSAPGLEAKYQQNGRGEHPLFSRKCWESLNKGTVAKDYWLWVEGQLARKGF